jgi:hypothetical protein
MFCPGADRYRRIALALPVAFALSAALASAQAPASPPAAAPAQATPAPADALGRSTPRGTVLGFLNAARKGENELAGEYLDTASSKPGAEELAHQLFVVLDARLQARLTLISDAPEGSRANPLEPDRELVGTIPAAGGDVQVYVDRVQRGKNPPVWLFSRASLAEIPSVYEEIATTPVNRFLPEFLIDARIGDLRLIDWIVIFLAVPAFFIATAFLNRLLVPLMRPIWRRLSGEEPHASKAALPVPARLLLLALLGRWLLSVLPLSLIVREFWASAAIVITIIAVAWLLVLLNGEIEAFIRRHVLRNKSPETVSLLRVVRRLGDVLVIFGGFLALLWRFGIDATPALAGLGVGGIAVALAAQKTLENVIAGASLIFDQAVPVDAHPHAGSHHRQRAERTDRQRRVGDALRARQVLVPPRGPAAVRHAAEAAARRPRPHQAAARGAAVDRARVGTRPVHPPRTVLVRHRGVRVRLRDRLGALPAAPGTAAAGDHRRGGSGRRLAGASVADDVRCGRRGRGGAAAGGGSVESGFSPTRGKCVKDAGNRQVSVCHFRNGVSLSCVLE